MFCEQYGVVGVMYKYCVIKYINFKLTVLWIIHFYQIKYNLENHSSMKCVNF